MKKNIILFAVIFCLFSGVKAFSQCIVSGGNLKKPIEYTTIEAIQKDAKKLLKAARKGELEMKFPVGSSFRNERDFERIFNNLRIWYNTSSECIDLSNEKQVDICIRIYLMRDGEYPELGIKEVTGLLSSDELRYIEEANRTAGYGYVTDKKRDELIAKITALKTEYDEKILKVITEEDQTKKQIESQEWYKNLVDKAKSYETKKEFAYALYWYKQADDELFSKIDLEGKEKLLSELFSEYKAKRNDIITAAKISFYGNGNDNQYKKIELKNVKTAGQAAGKYDELKSLIEAGNPGKGEFNEFALYDEWKNLLMNAEKFGTEYGRYTFTISQLKKGELDYKTKTATYTCEIKKQVSDVYESIISVIKAGYKKAYKSDWKDLPSPKDWPLFSVSGIFSNKDFVNGVAVYRQDKDICNSFACDFAGKNSTFKSNYGVSGYINDYATLYDLKVNVIDEDGKELIKPMRVLIEGIEEATTVDGYIMGRLDAETTLTYTGVPQPIMEKIDSGKAHVNILNMYLQYGTYSAEVDTFKKTGDKRSFIKNLKEIEIPLEKVKWSVQKESK
ncbi:MAG: hypothetical protein J6N81_10360 [Treponema sp.]|nr:hypothetical protein [Treponema sp.]